MNKRQVGTEYEKLAAKYLQEQGYRIIACNYRCKVGEIDLVAQENNTYVFVEVKYRKDGRLGGPLEAVDYRKQNKIRMVCNWYLMEHHIMDAPVRFDVVGILGTEITLIKNAF